MCVLICVSSLSVIVVEGFESLSFYSIGKDFRFRKMIFLFLGWEREGGLFVEEEYL